MPINLTGEEVFYNKGDANKPENTLQNFEEFKNAPEVKVNRELASEETSPSGESEESKFKSRDNIFSQLQALTSALENNDPKMIQSLLEKFDSTISRLVTLRTKIGSITNSVESSKASLDTENIDHAARRSALVDADVTELFSDITKQQAVLKTTYQASQGLMNQSLMDFLRR